MESDSCHGLEEEIELDCCMGEAEQHQWSNLGHGQACEPFRIDCSQKLLLNGEAVDSFSLLTDPKAEYTGMPDIVWLDKLHRLLDVSCRKLTVALGHKAVKGRRHITAVFPPTPPSLPRDQAKAGGLRPCGHESSLNQSAKQSHDGPSEVSSGWKWHVDIWALTFCKCAAMRFATRTGFIDSQFPRMGRQADPSPDRGAKCNC